MPGAVVWIENPDQAVVQMRFPWTPQEAWGRGAWMVQTYPGYEGGDDGILAVEIATGLGALFRPDAAVCIRELALVDPTATVPTPPLERLVASWRKADRDHLNAGHPELSGAARAFADMLDHVLAHGTWPPEDEPDQEAGA